MGIEMKIAMIGWEYPPFKVGGLGTHCYGLTRSLADRNVKVDFYMPKTRLSKKLERQKYFPMIDLKIKNSLVSFLKVYIDITIY